jgi:hypothetical protein
MTNNHTHRGDDVHPVEAAMKEDGGAYAAGWEACRLSVYAACEGVDLEATQDWPSGNLQARGMIKAAKSISRAFGAMSAPTEGE